MEKVPSGDWESGRTDTGRDRRNVNEDSILEIFGIIPDAMAEHFKHIKGDLSQYANIEGRITVK